MFLIKAEKSCCFLFSDFATITLSVFLMSVRYSSLILSIREMILFLNFGQRLTLFSDFLSVGVTLDVQVFENFSKSRFLGKIGQGSALSWFFLGVIKKFGNFLES